MSSVIKIRDNRLEKLGFMQVLEVLNNHGVIVYPTETFYGLGGLANSEIALSRVYSLKGRNWAQPLPFIASDFEMVSMFVQEMPEEALVLAEKFWPGPLTLVLKASTDKLPALALGPGETIAVRVPPLEWLQELVRAAGWLLVSTSANLSGQPPLSSFNQVYELFGQQVDVLIDGGDTPGAFPSTILDLTVSPPKCLREGVIPFDEILSALC